MVTKITKETLVPLSLIMVVLYAMINVVSRFTHMEAKIQNQEKTDEVHTERLIQVTNQMQKLNENMIRQSEIMNKIEEKLK